MPTTTGGRLQELALQHRAALEAGNQAAADALEQSLTQAMERVNQEIAALLRDLERARAEGKAIPKSWLYRQHRLTGVRATIRREIAQWAPQASREVRQAALEAAHQADAHARALTRLAAQEETPGAEVTFGDINPENIAQITAHLAPDGPLTQLLMNAGEEAAQAAASALTQGVALGKGSDWIAKRVTKALNIPAWRGETIARTESLRAYREVSRQTYASSNVVTSWTWHAWIDRRTCVACVCMDGTEHPTSETLDGHPRCRCSMVPKTATWAQLGLGSDLPDTSPPMRVGEDWLKDQSPEVQRALMGPAKYDAFKRGDITIQDMVARTHSPEWGTMRRERSLIEIREGRNANTWATKPAMKVPEPPVRPAVRPAAPSPDVVTLDRMSGAELDRLRMSGKYLDHKDELAKRGDDILQRVLANPEAPAARQLAARDLLEERKKYGDGLPPGMPKSRQSNQSLLDYQTALRAAPDKVVANNLRHKDPGARHIAKAELERRRELAGPPPNTLEAKLAKGDPDGSMVATAKTNPLYATGTAYQVNCTNCATTWELRRRGFKVEAAPRPTLKGRGWTDTAVDWEADVADMVDSTLLQAERRALKYGDGARGAISVSWKAGGAHIFNWEVRHGKVEWFDGQPGWNGQGLVESYGHRIKGHVQLIRLDHLPINDRLGDYLA